MVRPFSGAQGTRFFTPYSLHVGPAAPSRQVFKINGWGKPTASSLSADGFPLIDGPNFQPSHGIPTVISILRQLADGPDNVPEM